MKDPEPSTGLFISPRRNGKTTRVLEWLTKGHPIKGPRRLDWSRIMVCADARDVDRLIHLDFEPARKADHLIQQRGFEPGLRGCVFSFDSLRNRRQGVRSVLGGPAKDRQQIMVDDLDTLMWKFMGFWPDYATFTGHVFDPDGEPDPWEPGGYRMANDHFHKAWYHPGLKELHFHRDPYYSGVVTEAAFRAWEQEARNKTSDWTDEQRRRLYEGRWDPEEEHEFRHGLGSPDAESGAGDLEPPAHDGPGEPPVRPA